MAVALGWLVLALVFVDEVAAAVAVSVWGTDAGGEVLGAVCVVLVFLVWGAFASPKAPYGGPVVRPAVKVAVFLLASLALVAAGHPRWGAGLLLFSAVVNALAQLPAVRALVPEQESGSEPV